LPIYGTAQAGSNATLGLNLTSLIPGEQITLFSGSETAALNLKSVAFARGYSPSASDQGTTFNISGMPSGMTIDVQVASKDIDGDYTSVVTMTPDTNGNSAYTDVGRSAFFRLLISAYTTGAMPIAVAQR
jgi:hypothetical protein